MVSNKKIHRALRTHTCNSFEQYPLEKFFIFTIYQNYTLALKVYIESISLLWIMDINSVFSFCFGKNLLKDVVDQYISRKDKEMLDW